MRCECYRIGGPFIAEDPNCPIHGYEAQAREKEEKAYRESEEEKQNELLARIVALEEKIDAMAQCAQPAPSVPNLDMDALERKNDALKEDVGRLRDALALIADQYEPKCYLLIPSIARSALCATGAYGQTEAQPAPSVRSASLYPVINWLRNGCDPMKAADELEMLAAAPEAKP